MSPSASQQQPNVWIQSNQSALEFFRFRQMQSTWYTQLFQSGREAWSDPYPYIWKKYYEMSDWFNKLSSSTLPATRDFFELELLYSYVYILSPNLRCPHISTHAQRLIFEHCTTYAEKMLNVTSSPSEVKNPLTFYDSLRVYITARHFVDVLAAHSDTLLRPNGATPASAFSIHSSLEAEVDPLATVVPGIVPSIPAPTCDTPGGLPKDQTSRAIDTINRFLDILSYFGARFGNIAGISWRDRFQKDSQTLLSQLYQLRQQQNHMEQGYPIYNGGPITPPTHLSTSPGPSATFYPSPASTQYSPASGYVQMNHPVGNTRWEPANSNFLSLTSAADMSSGMLVPSGLDNLGIGNFAAWETLPGGSLNPRFGL